VLLQALMRSYLVKVDDVGLEGSEEVLCMQNQQVIEALTTHISQKALAARIGTRA
jgi:hypothetical protein